MLRLPCLLLSLGVAAGASAQGFGSVYTLTNDPVANSVKVTLRLPNGGLLPFAEFATAGTGTGGGLGSQEALATSDDGRLLLATNPGSHQITLFRVLFGLFLLRTDTEPSGGTRPTSVALRNGLVYVLNAGSDSIAGFRIQTGQLVPIPGANYPLSQMGAAAAQIGFSPDGNFVVVTERATHRIGVFRVLANGTLGAGQFQPSAANTPFGYLFRNDGTLVVSEANGGTPGASFVSTYSLDALGTLTAITPAAPTHQTAACWIAIPVNGQFAYTTNTGSGTITGYALSPAGALSILDPSGVTGDLGAAARPLDFDFTPNGRFLYVLDSAADRIETFRRHNDGSLERLTASVALQDGAAGLIVR